MCLSVYLLKKQTNKQADKQTNQIPAHERKKGGKGRIITKNYFWTEGLLEGRGNTAGWFNRAF